ncbi:response regulator transcription factor [Hymenobacter sp. NBH84]|uniref:response regulator transcription factor n=1 Tax=Hymenobacter sp. NBH84 TaxID=2596915 RepID=UPI0016282E17|nr:response regulator transcription factor [Hymenobacter sp. NBH84]QNE38505.1 response regulator transcription factor [Hymenobacter sp. NBH84]
MSEQRISVYLVDDHPLVLEGVKTLLHPEADICVVGQANSGPEALAQLPTHPEVQVAVIDMNMPQMSGVELTQALRTHYPQIRVLVLSMDDDYAQIREVLDAGGMGYLLKNTTREELSTAIRTIAAGRTFFSQEIGNTILQHSATVGTTPVNLTAREHEILRLIAREYSNNLIAETLFISERTVETHRKNILVKTNSKSVVGLIQYALRHKLIP